MTADEDRVEVLKLILGDVEKERDRLRAARASWTARLGPLPASAAVVTGVAAAAAGKVDWVWVVLSLGVFLLLMGVSIGFSGLKPYRELRHDYQREFDEDWSEVGVGFRDQETNVARWLEQKIKLEERICGPPGERRSRRWPTRDVGSLTHAINVERAAANIVQGLSLLMFLLLLVGVGTA